MRRWSLHSPSARTLQSPPAPRARASSRRTRARAAGSRSTTPRAWRNPERVIEKLLAHRVHTLYLQTSNYRQTVDVVRPAKLGRFLDAADAAGIDVVGWYLPSLASPSRDLRRALAGARFRSAAGNGFDAFALDIEATKVRSFALRNRRAISFAAAVRRAARTRVSARRDHARAGRQQPDLLAELPVPRARRARGRRPADDLLHGARGRCRATSAAIRRPAYDHPRADRASFPLHAIGGEARHAPLAEVKAFLAQRRVGEDASGRACGSTAR